MAATLAASKTHPAATPRSSAKADGYIVEPVPAWVVPAKERASTPVDRAAMHYRLIDDQLRLDGKSVDHYTHVVQIADTAAGLGTASQIELQFDPGYQTLALHRVEVVRDGKRMDRLDRKRIQLLHRETQLERQMLDGRSSLSIVIDDVRVGDEIDYAYSVRGANPVFDGKFVQTQWLGTPLGPVALRQIRLLAPSDRMVRHTAPPVDVQVETHTVGGLRETVLRQESVAQLRTDQRAPFTAVLPYAMQFSEFTDWADVARWGTALFAQPGGGAALDDEANRIRAQTPDRSRQLLAALDFVQKDVRYFGTELGANSHRPAAPDAVIAQRFGDCKDKVTLLIALLHRLDFEATPMLVSSVLHDHVGALPETPLAFDHVIARVRLDNAVYDLDATRTHQTGLLGKRQSVGFGKGLLLDAGTTTLTALRPAFDTEQVAVTDTVHFEQMAQDPTLRSRITFRGDSAEAWRGALEASGPQELSTRFSAAYLRLYPKLKATAPMQIEQSSDDDAVTFIQQFTIPGYWRFPQERQLVTDIVHWSTIETLTYPKSETRKDAFALALGIYRHTVDVDFPQDVFTKPASSHTDDGDAHVRVVNSVQGTLCSIDNALELHVAADEVAAADWPAYVTTLDKVSPRLAGSLTISPVPPDRLEALGAALKKLDADLRNKRAKAATPVQREAQIRAVVLTAEIDAHQLPPALESQARVARGVQYDNMGRAAEGEHDFVKAVALAPDSVEALNAAAVNAAQQHEQEKSIDFADRALALDAHNSEALHSRGMAHYFLKQAAGARADFERELKDSANVRRGYPVVWLGLAMKEDGQEPKAAVVGTDELPKDWPRPLIDLLWGETDEASVIAAAKATKSPEESLCEAYFYIAEKHYLEGDDVQATAFWRKSSDLGITEFVEDSASRGRLMTSSAR